MTRLSNDLKLTPRDQQVSALEFVKKSINHDKKFILLDLPPGIGKSYLALMISDWYINNKRKNAKFDILTNQKILQDQYTNEFKSIDSLSGKDNYQCDTYACSCAGGSEFNTLNRAKSCEACPYQAAKSYYMQGDISLTNFHLYILMTLYNPRFKDERKANILIVDEAHDFDTVFSDFISININENTFKRLKFINENELVTRFRGVKDKNDYLEFIKHVSEGITETMDELSKELEGSHLSINRSLKIDNINGNKNPKLKIVQIMSMLKDLGQKIVWFLSEHEKNPNIWVMEKSFLKDNAIELQMTPVWSSEYLNEYVWSRYDHVIMMSGTILNKELFCFLNGLDVNKTSYMGMSSPFPVENRPIYYIPSGKMNYRSKEETFKGYVPVINKILKKYKGKKGIIHTVNYELAQWMQTKVKDERLLYSDSSNRNITLTEHYDSEEDTVLVSPSMTTGLDLKHDRARFQILLKIPYPSLQSEKNKLRQQLRPDWYTWRTIVTIIQAYGRAVRSYNDFADFIILDECFSDVMRYSSHMFPPYVAMAIKRPTVK
jgi:ATP-dependent DNA helicase DinG